MRTRRRGAELLRRRAHLRAVADHEPLLSPRGRRVHIAAARDDGAVLHAQRDYGAVGREAVRDATVRDAVALLLTLTE